MPGHTYLHPKDSGSYYFLRRTPKALLPAFFKNGMQQRLVKVALRTKNLAEARRRMQRTAVEVQDQFDKAEQHMGGDTASSVTTITASEADLRAMVSRWLYDLDKGAVGQHLWATEASTREQLLASCDEEEAALQGESGAPGISGVARDILNANTGYRAT